MNRIVSVLLLLLALLIAAIPYPALATGGDPITLSYPVLDSTLNYYQTAFPSGLKYSPGWYGTFSYAPPAAQILLFDDDWSKDFGICIFSMKTGTVPHGEQGGTTLWSITQKQANSFIKSYSSDVALKPFDPEIQAVMPVEAYFTGVWAGEKLRQKWAYGSASNTGPPILTTRQKAYLADIADKPIKTVDLTKYDPDRFWVGGSGNWSDNTTHWSDVSGGAAGASLPTSADAVFFDLNSFTAPGQTVTVDATTYCLSMNWTGALNNPTFTGTSSIITFGSVIFIAGMTNSYSGTLFIESLGDSTFTAGTALACQVIILTGDVARGYTLQDNLDIGSKGLSLRKGYLTTNGYSISCNGIDAVTLAFTLTPSTSTINCSSWTVDSTLLTLVPNTSTINISGTGAFAGSSITTYNDIYLNGTAHTVSGTFSCATFALPPGTTQTITVTAGNKITCTTATLSGDATHAHTIQSGTAGTLASIWATNKTDAYVAYTDMLRNYNGVIVVNCSGSGGGTFAGAGGTFTSMTVEGAGAYDLIITGDNTFNVLSVDATAANKGITLTGTTQTVTNLQSGTVSTNNVTITGGNLIKANTIDEVLDYMIIVSNNATPLNTWYAGGMSINGGGNTGWNFPFTVTTLPATNIVAGSGGVTTGSFNGQLADRGGIASANVSFQYGKSLAYGSSTTIQVMTATGNYTAAIPTNLEQGALYHYQAIAVNTDGTVYGSDITFIVPFTILTDYPVFATIATLIPAVLFLIIIFAGLYLMFTGLGFREKVAGLTFLIFALSLFSVLFNAIVSIMAGLY